MSETMADAEAGAIRTVLFRYARGVDRGDLDLVLSAFHPDATAHHGAGFSGNAHDAWRKRLGPDAEPMDRVGVGPADPAQDRLVAAQHHISNHLVDFDEARTVARSEAYFLAYYLSERAGRRYLATVGGRYVDRFELREGEWRIAHRESVHDWDRVDEIVNTFPNGHRWLQGRRDRSDPSYLEAGAT